jgi:hypothetical protein
MRSTGVVAPGRSAGLGREYTKWPSLAKTACITIRPLGFSGKSFRKLPKTCMG